MTTTSATRGAPGPSTAAATGLVAAITTALAAGEDLQAVFARVVDGVPAFVDGAHTVQVWLLEESMLALAARSAHSGTPLGLRVPVRRQTSGRALADGRPLLVSDVRVNLDYRLEQWGMDGLVTAVIAPVCVAGERVGLLSALGGPDASFTPADADALELVADVTGIAVLSARSRPADRVRTLLEGAEAERRRWSHELHDQTLQGLLAITLSLDRIVAGAPQALVAQLTGVGRQARGEIDALRGIIADLRPPALEALGLESALHGLLSQLPPGGPTASAHIALDGRRADPVVELTAYRVAQEALHNVVRHAGASRVHLSATVAGQALCLEVTDDGVGLAGAPSDAVAHHGLATMRERAEMTGGELVVDGSHGTGTRIRLTLPLAEHRPGPLAAGRAG